MKYDSRRFDTFVECGVGSTLKDSSAHRSAGACVFRHGIANRLTRSKGDIGVESETLEKKSLLYRASRGIGRRSLSDLPKTAVTRDNLRRKRRKSRQSAENAVSSTPTPRIYRCNVADAEAVAATFKEISRRFQNNRHTRQQRRYHARQARAMMKQSDFTTSSRQSHRAFNTVKAVYPYLCAKTRRKDHQHHLCRRSRRNAGQVNYARRSRIIGLTKSVAKELGSRGVCCNAISSGFIETDMTAFAVRIIRSGTAIR